MKQTKQQKRENKFIDLTNGLMFGECAKNQFKYKLDFVGYVGLGLIGFGLVTLPLPTGSPLFIGIGLLLVSPLSIKKQIKNRYSDLKFYIESKLIKWGFI